MKACGNNINNSNNSIAAAATSVPITEGKLNYLIYLIRGPNIP